MASKTHSLRLHRAESPALPARSQSGPVGIKVATWNIAWLGDGIEDSRLTGNRNGGRHLRSDEDFGRLREIAIRLAGLGVEVVGIQEAENEMAIRRIFPRAEWDLYPSGREVEPAWAQLTAILVRRDVGFAVTRHADVKAFSPYRRNRFGVDLTLSRDGRSVRVLTLHFQSSCQWDPLSARRCGVLNTQIKVLEAWLLNRILLEKVPVVIAGDWNRWLSEPGDEAFAELPLEPVIAPLAGQQPECWDGRYDWAVDHIVAFSPEGISVSVSDFTELLYEQSDELRDKLSDHCAMSASVRFEG